MNRTSGNNAIKNSNLCDDVRFEVCGNKNVKTRTVKFTSTKRLRTVKVSPKINEQRIKAERHIQKKMARKRFLKFSVCIVVIGIVAISFIGILSQYANILKMHQSNIAIEQKIKEANIESGQIREELVKVIDPNMIRKTAINEYGMREPSKSQKIKVEIPNGDKVIFNNSNVTVDNLDDDYDKLFQNLEGFFKTMR